LTDYSHPFKVFTIVKGGLSTVVDNLFKSGGAMNIGQPLKTLLPMGLDESITPGFSFLKNKIQKK
jgi:hypothetical protein